MNLIGLPHFVQAGGGVFLAMGALARSGGSAILSVTDNYRCRAVMNQHAHPTVQKASQIVTRLLRLVLKPRNEAFAAPKLDRAAICKASGFANCIVIIIAI
jgi:hypothetical protein